MFLTTDLVQEAMEQAEGTVICLHATPPVWFQQQEVAQLSHGLYYRGRGQGATKGHVCGWVPQIENWAMFPHAISVFQ